MKNLIVILIILITGSSKCVMDGLEEIEPDSTLTIVNNSAEELIYITSIQDDTTLEKMEFIKDKVQYEALTIKANSLIEDESNWIYSFTNNETPDTLRVFLFAKNTIVNTEWDQIESEYLILKRYDLTLSDLDSLDWTITYP